MDNDIILTNTEYLEYIKAKKENRIIIFDTSEDKKRIQQLIRAKEERRILELPCSLGTTVHQIIKDNIIPIKFTIDLLPEFNKTVFLTYEQANKKLNESIKKI